MRELTPSEFKRISRHISAIIRNFGKKHASVELDKYYIMYHFNEAQEAVIDHLFK